MSSINRMTYIETYVNNNKKSAVLAYALWFFFGMFGAHRFYMGKVGTGLVQLALTIFFAWWTYAIIPGIWVLIDAFLLPGMLANNKNKLRQEAIALSESSN
ncbi:MAG TPA: TM2 domain-containing protein [Alloiococcus sp.]|nr:TM2 domain-containing protein [Alloiococcus sp.]